MGKRIVYGIVGQKLDAISRHHRRYEKRFERWRPTVSLALLPEVTEIHLLHDGKSTLHEQLTTDILSLNPGVSIQCHAIEFADPWDLASTHLALSDFFEDQFRRHPPGSDDEYLAHVTTGTHIQQIVLFKLVESHTFPGRLLQTAPTEGRNTAQGRYHIIDLDLEQYDAIAERTRRRKEAEESDLKRGIATRNAAYNALIAEIEVVARRSPHPILLTGPTGSGKSDLARRLHALKRKVGQISGTFVEVNCATLRGDNAMSALFGHRKGAFTGAVESRQGFLKQAEKGILFLDEIGTLPLDEQAMLLSAIEQKRFYPLGSDQAETSDFQLIAGTNENLDKACEAGTFRRDLLARINLWDFRMPGLKDRIEDLEPNLDYELLRASTAAGERIRMTRDAKTRYLTFGLSPQAQWVGNFRDLISSVRRMATLCDGGLIGTEDVAREILRLLQSWGASGSDPQSTAFQHGLVLPEALVAQIDPIDLPSLQHALQVLSESKSMAAAGRRLFRSSGNYSHRMKKWLERFGISGAVLAEISGGTGGHQ